MLLKDNNTATNVKEMGKVRYTIAEPSAIPADNISGWPVFNRVYGRAQSSCVCIRGYHKRTRWGPVAFEVRAVCKPDLGIFTFSEIERCLPMQVNHDTGQPRMQASDSLVT